MVQYQRCKSKLSHSLGCEFNSRIMTVAKDLCLLSLTTSVACQIVSSSHTEAMEFFTDSNYLRYTMKYIRCNTHPLALHCLVVSVISSHPFSPKLFIYTAYLTSMYSLLYFISVVVQKIQWFISMFSYLNLPYFYSS